MNFFNKFFKRNKNRNRNENPLFTIIKEAFPIDFDFSDYTIYHIKSFEYKESNIFTKADRINRALNDILRNTER